MAELVNPVDRAFLLFEKRNQPMHIGVLQLFSWPEDEGPDYVTRLAETMRSYTRPEPPFGRRIVTRYGVDFWEDDRYFDLEHHFRHRGLPKPGRIRELLAYVSAAHSHLMDRERPLWEVHLIEGLPNRQFAIYTKIHHAMMDGTSGVRLMTRAFDPTPGPRNLPPLWAVPPRPRRHEVERRPAPGLGSALELARTHLRGGAQFAKELREASRLQQRALGQVSPLDAPTTVVNEKITGSRRFAAQSVSLARIRRIAAAYDATLNDAVLAICGGALREYLLAQDALPAKPLVAMVPVNLRDGDSEGGNDIALILASLGTHIEDPRERIDAVVRSTRASKARFRRMTPTYQKAFTALSMMPAGLNILSGGRLPGLQTFNVVVSNMPGPKEPIYWNGARLNGVYPVAFLMDHMALNVTLMSYVDHLEFGLTACRRTLPSMQRLLPAIENAMVDLERAAGLGRPESREATEEILDES